VWSGIRAMLASRREHCVSETRTERFRTRTTDLDTDCGGGEFADLNPSAAILGRTNGDWALATMFLGIFVFLFLTAVWAAPANLLGIASATAVGVIGSCIVTAGLALFTRIAHDEQSPATTRPGSTTTQPSTVTTTTCSCAATSVPPAQPPQAPTSGSTATTFLVTTTSKI
jgi:hypothetical protein